jgi:hypothetical protein
MSMEPTPTPTPSPTPDDEVPELRKYQVSVTLDTLLGSLSARPRRLLQAPAGQPAPDVHPDIAPHLQRIAELADAMQQEINQIRQIDAGALDRFKLQ